MGKEMVVVYLFTFKKDKKIPSTIKSSQSVCLL